LAGLIDDFQLETALSHQRNWGGRLGSALVELEFVSETDVAKVIADKLRIPYANLFEPEIPETVVRLIKQEIAKKYLVMPARKEAGGVVVAMSDPLDIRIIDELRFITGLNIKPALAVESDIKLAIRKYYDHEEVVRKPAASLREIARSSGKMEIIHGSDLNMPKAEADQSGSRDESAAQAIFDSKLRIDALIALLVEKGIITREEIVTMIYQKKMGL
jgi:type IV pilus assembly protein PilB